MEAQAKSAARLWQDHCERKTNQQSCYRAQDERTAAHGCPVVHEHQADDQRDDADQRTQCQWWPRSARLPEGLEIDGIVNRHGPPRRPTVRATTALAWGALAGGDTFDF